MKLVFVLDIGETSPDICWLAHGLRGMAPVQRVAQE
jgi:hypothetical protein